MRAQAVGGRAVSSSGVCAPGSTTRSCRRGSFRSPTHAAKAMAEPSTPVPAMRRRRVLVILMVFSPHAAPRPWGTIPHMVVHDLAGSGSGEQAGAPDIGALAVDPDRGSRLADADGQDRYLRQMRLPQLGAQGQRRLAAARVAVIGAGGLGAPVLTYLAAAGIGEITLIDPDVVDRTNLHRQVIFESKDVGRSKVVTAAEHLHTLNPQVRVRALVDVVTAANALELLAGHDLVLDGTDNFPTRYRSEEHTSELQSRGHLVCRLLLENNRTQ